MFPVKARLFGLTTDIFFPSPVALPDAKMGEFGAALSSAFSIAPSQIRLRHTDILYGYDLSVAFFGGNGLLERTAERVRLVLNNAKADSDRLTIEAAHTRIFEMLKFDPERSPGGAIWVHAHVAFEDSSSYDSYFGRIGVPQGAIRAGILGYVQTTQFEDPLRISVEPSLVYTASAFISINVAIAPGESFYLKDIEEALIKTIKVMGLEITFIKDESEVPES